MKTYKNLYPQVYSFMNLYQAYRKARKGKRYKAANLAFEQNLDEELFSLQQELRDETWQPGGFRSFTVHEPKRRKISAAVVPPKPPSDPPAIQHGDVDEAAGASGFDEMDDANR